MTLTNFPLNTQYASAGGAVLPPEWLDIVVKATLDVPGVLDLCNVELTDAFVEVMRIYNNDAQVEAVAEGGVISETFATVGAGDLHFYKFAASIGITTEQWDQALQSGPDTLMGLLQGNIAMRMGQTLAANVLGMNNGVLLSTGTLGAPGAFDFAIVGDTSNPAVYLDDFLSEQDGHADGALANDAYRLAVSSAYQDLRLQGFNPDGHLTGLSGEQHSRDARSGLDTTNPLYHGNVSELAGGLPVKTAVTQHLQAFSLSDGTLTTTNTGSTEDPVWATDQIVGVVGDFSRLQTYLRSDIRNLVSDVAAGTSFNAYTQDGILSRWTARFGCNTLEPNAFVLIKAKRSS